MYIIEVIPVTRSIGSDTLSYFTTKPVSLGDIVDISLRKKTVHGIVISIKKAEDMKSEIKTASFALKKIDKIKGTKFFTDHFMEMIKETAEYNAVPTGIVINTLVPKYIIENISKLKIDKSQNKSEEKPIPEVSHTPNESRLFAVQGDSEERFSAWKSMVRQEFAKKKSVLIINPTVEDTEHSFKMIERGIEGYAFILHGTLTPKTIIETWNRIMKEEHPVVIVATGGFLSIPRADISTLILENESSRTYKIMRRPYLDIRQVCESFSKKNGIKMFFADNFLRIETLYKINEGMIVKSSPFKTRSVSSAVDTLVDMKKYKSSNSNFRILSDEVESLIRKTKTESEGMIILANRRGIAPSTVCGDCQNIVVCNKCSAPVVLHRTNENGNRGSSTSSHEEKEKTFFMCHRCGERRSSEEYCKFCGSWKLGTVGIGIDLVIEKIKSKFPDISIFKIDADTTKTAKSAQTAIQKFRAKPGSILIGTEMILQYLHEKVENSAVISLDSLFALPDFRIQEKILYILIRIRELSTKSFIIQTRKSDEKVFEYGLKGNIVDFYKSTIEERRNFNYPPFTTLIKITLEGKKDEIVKEMEQAQNILDPFEVEVFPAFTHTVKGNYVLHGLIRIPNNKWPDYDLNSKLRLLPPNITIKIDPETLL